MIRIHVAVHGHLIRDVIAEALRRRDGMEVVGSTAEGVEGVEAAAGLQPDVVVFSEPDGEPPERWADEFRRVAPAAGLVLLLLSSRAVDPAGGGGADAVVDASDGLAELAHAIRRVDDAR